MCDSIIQRCSSCAYFDFCLLSSGLMPAQRATFAGSAEYVNRRSGAVRFVDWNAARIVERGRKRVWCASRVATNCLQTSRHFSKANSRVPIAGGSGTSRCKFGTRVAYSRLSRAARSGLSALLGRYSSLGRAHSDRAATFASTECTS